MVDAAGTTRAPLVHVTRVYLFNAGHRLFHPDRDAEWNFEVFGKCSYASGHGHNYRLDVTVRGSPDPETGRVIPIGVLDEIVERTVLEPIDHRNLNDVLRLELAPVPTTEVLAVEIWERLAPCMPPPGRLDRIVISETSKNTFEYRGPEAAREAAGIAGSGPSPRSR